MHEFFVADPGRRALSPFPSSLQNLSCNRKGQQNTCGLHSWRTHAYVWADSCMNVAIANEMELEHGWNAVSARKILTLPTPLSAVPVPACIPPD